MPQKKKMEASTWRKSSPELVSLFDSLASQFPGLQKRVMFGFPCAFWQGNMFSGLHQEHLFFRLAAAEKSAFLKIPGAAPFEPVHGRVMSEYVTAPASMLKDEAALHQWFAASLKYAQSLPPRNPK
jgi:TfoX/Sxy family transcriptional regulator of competence genes